MSATIHSTTDRDAELTSLRDGIYADCAGPQFSRRDAAECALGQLAGLMEYAAEWDQAADEMLLAAYWPAVDSVEEVTTEPEPEPTPPTSPAARKAAWHLSQGVAVIAHAGGYLVPSGTRAGVVHFVDDAGVCSCEAGQHGRSCWHLEAVRQAGKVAA